MKTKLEQRISGRKRALREEIRNMKKLDGQLMTKILRGKYVDADVRFHRDNNARMLRRKAVLFELINLTR